MKGAPGGSRGYLLCGTPRTGSTLLCELLTSTGVAGRPESYFRGPDQLRWADRFGLSVANGSLDYREFAAAARRFGTTSNGVFAARVMWGTVEVMCNGLDPRRRTRTDLDVLEGAFGPLSLVHLVREDVVAQAVSWARAEQSGYWQRGDGIVAEPELDLAQLHRLVHTITEHTRAWRSWFRAQEAAPLQVTYEELVHDPQTTVLEVLDHVGVDAPADWTSEVGTPQQADELNAEWARRYRETVGATSG